MLRTHSAAPLVGGEPKAPAWGLGDGDLEGDLGEEQRQGQEEERGRVEEQRNTTLKPQIPIVGKMHLLHLTS